MKMRSKIRQKEINSEYVIAFSPVSQTLQKLTESKTISPTRFVLVKRGQVWHFYIYNKLS